MVWHVAWGYFQVLIAQCSKVGLMHDPTTYRLESIPCEEGLGSDIGPWCGGFQICSVVLLSADRLMSAANLYLYHSYNAHPHWGSVQSNQRRRVIGPLEFGSHFGCQDLRAYIFVIITLLALTETRSKQSRWPIISLSGFGPRFDHWELRDRIE